MHNIALVHCKIQIFSELKQRSVPSPTGSIEQRRPRADNGDDNKSGTASSERQTLPHGASFLTQLKRQCSEKDRPIFMLYIALAIAYLICVLSVQVS